jgi:iron complex outermembrane receptor protein
MRKLFLLFVLLAFGVSSAFAGTLAGKVTAKETGEVLVGANVYLKGTTIGAATDEDGMFYIKVDDGTYTVVCDYVGYAASMADVEVSGDTKVDFALTEYLFAKTIDVIADRARERETPVAYTQVDKMQITSELGSQDIPMVLNATPSVYATMGGGGAGDARINVRGFNQRNIAIMINGVPVNDMENGWVYWSNWDGVGDASQSIQMQRGLSSVNLATPAIGGTMNIITDPTASEMGFMLKQEYGSGTFLKTTFTAASG